MLVVAKNCINILALEGGPCAISSPEVYPAIFNTSRQILIDSRRMADEAHPVHLENGIEATEIAAPTVPRGRGRPRGPQTLTNPQPVARRINRLEGAVLDLSNVMAQFVATMRNAQDALIPAAVRLPSTQDNSIGHEGQDPAQAAYGEQAARRARNQEASQSRTRGESQGTRVSVFD